jgi:hypothetical protein
MALDLKDTAKSIIRSLAGTSELGLFYICKNAGGVTDPDTGQYTPGTIEKVAIDGALVKYSQPLIDGVNIQNGDAKLICTFEAPIETESYVEVYGDRWTIINPNPLNHAGQVQIYQMQLRKS